MFVDKTILITGGTGSWGRELTKQLLEKNPREIRIFSRNEFLSVSMQRDFNNPKIKFIPGDVRDLDALVRVCKNVDYLVHLAALKHIPVCEEYPEEALLTNVSGTLNVIKAAKQCGVLRVIDVSTDKAANPLNFYGLTKAIGEQLVLAANKDGDTRFTCVRGGNVLGSNGSVVQYFIDQIKLYKRVPITDLSMTRFFLTIPQAIKLLFTALESGTTGVTFVMRMPSCRILDLAKILIRNYGSADIQVTGIRKGEKLHEVLVTEDEGKYTFVYDNSYFLIDFNRKSLVNAINKRFSSNDSLMSTEELTNLLKMAKFL